MYRSYMQQRLESEPGLVGKLLDLRGGILGCYCKPQRCHGDILVELINKYEVVHEHH